MSLVKCCSCRFPEKMDKSWEPIPVGEGWKCRKCGKWLKNRQADRLEYGETAVAEANRVQRRGKGVIVKKAREMVVIKEPRPVYDPARIREVVPLGMVSLELPDPPRSFEEVGEDLKKLLES